MHLLYRIVVSVKFVNGLSSSFLVLSEVPQGSPIGPLLSILFPNDVVSVLNYSKCVIDADILDVFYLSEQEYKKYN